jgi:hypothetical protein
MAQSNARSETNAPTQTQANSQPEAPVYQARPPRNQKFVKQYEPAPPQVAKVPVVKQEAKQMPDKGNTSQRQQQVDIDEPKRLSLAELFAPDTLQRENGDNDNDSGPVDSIDGVSKRLGLKPEEVYSIKVPMPNGAEPVTIGDLKDRVGELVDLETREAQFDQRRIKSEGELLRAQTELRDVLSMIPKENIPTGIVEKLRKRHDATVARERELTLEHIPSWQDQKACAADIEGINEMLADYGFDDTFITTVVDHRALKFIRDAYLRDKRIKAALAKVTTPTKRGKTPSSKTGKAAKSPNAYESQTSRHSGAVADERTRVKSLFGD